ncbi:DUF4843 domain-containing protein [Sphingobacterium spiritivorum]|uniref:DUF4843 domain-containing protein n=1 Tax=Sphingobacterium spiritivorum TaxID=258 RepID=UPI003DA2921E
MKTYISLLAVLISVLFTSCFKDHEEDFYLPDFRIEFQDAVMNTNSPGLSYPILKELRNKAGVQKYQVNLIGGLKDTDQTVKVRIRPESTAKADQHYKLPKGSELVIPANSAFGYFEVEIPELTNTTAVSLVFDLESNDQLKVSANYSTLALTIRK